METPKSRLEELFWLFPWKAASFDAPASKILRSSADKTCDLFISFFFWLMVMVFLEEQKQRL